MSKVYVVNLFSPIPLEPFKLHFPAFPEKAQNGGHQIKRFRVPTGSAIPAPSFTRPKPRLSPGDFQDGSAHEPRRVTSNGGDRGLGHEAEGPFLFGG